MTCDDALQAMLEADPSELEGSGDSSLARHLQECDRCRSMAETILAGEALLAHGLVSAVSPPELNPLLDEVLGVPPVPVGPSTDTNPPEKTLRFPWRRAAAALFPLAAAATLAALFLGRAPQLPGDPYRLAPETPGLGLVVPEGRDVAVLATNNPEITVLWFF